GTPVPCSPSQGEGIARLLGSATGAEDTERFQAFLVEHDAPDAGGAAGRRIDVHDRPTHARVALRHVERTGNEGDGGEQHAVDAAAKNTVVWPRHADVADEGGAAGQDLFIGGGRGGGGAGARTAR